MKLGDIVTYAVVGLCGLAGVAIVIVVAFARHAADDVPELVPAHVDGVIVAKGTVLGEWTQHPNACVWTEITGNDGMGIWVLDRDEPTHGLGVSRDNHELVFAVPATEGKIPVRFSRGTCSTWDVAIERGDRLRLEINGKRDETHFYWNGHFQFDCTKDGETARGNVRFEHCLRP